MFFEINENVFVLEYIFSLRMDFIKWNIWECPRLPRLKPYSIEIHTSGDTDYKKGLILGRSMGMYLIGFEWNTLYPKGGGSGGIPPFEYKKRFKYVVG